MAARPDSLPFDIPTQRALAAELFNLCWTLLETPERDASQTELMVNAAHASRLFWEEAGGPVNHARGEWQLSRVYAVVGRSEPALHHARRCLELCQANAIDGFDLAFAHEALARAQLLAGESEAAKPHEEEARRISESIEDADDRQLLLDDLGTLPQ